MAVSPDQEERRAIAKDPAKYNPRNPWPRVDRYAAQLREQQPVDLMPEEDFSNQAIAERELVEGQLEGQNVLRFLQYVKNPQLAAEDIEYGPAQAAARKLTSDFWSKEAEAAIRNSINRRVDRKQVRKLENYPSILNAVIQAQANGDDVDEDDVARLIDYVAANEAAEMILSTNDKIRQQNILKTANPLMRAAIGDIIAEKLAEVAEGVEKGEGNVALNILTDVGTGLLAPFEFLWNEGQQGIRFATQVNPFTPPSQREGRILPWGSFEAGNFRQEDIDQLKKEYDPLAVDIMLDMAKASARNVEDHVGEVMAMEKYATDEAGLIFRQLLYAADSNPQLMELARKIDEANLGTTGPVLYNSFFGDIGTGTVWRNRVQGGLSIGAAFLDPTIFASRAINAVRGVKYALAKIAPGEDVTTAFASKVIAGRETNRARVYFDRMIKDLDELDKIDDAAEAARVRGVIGRQYKEVPDEVITEIRTQKFKDVDEFANFVNEANAANKLIRGGIIPEANIAAQSILAEKTLYERLFTTLPQTRQAMLPRMSLGRFLRQQGAMAISATVMPKARAKEVIETYYGKGATADDVARIMFDNGLDIGAADQSRALLARGALGRTVDRFFQKFASLPNKNYIVTSDASDAQTFYRFARSFLTKYHATYLTDAFRAANPGQRRLMVAGLIRSAAASRGVDFSKETILHRIDDLATGFTADELYSAARVEKLTSEGVAFSRFAAAPLPASFSQQIDTLYSDIFDEANRIAAAEGKTLAQMSLGQGDDLAAKIIDARARILLEDNPELLGKGIFESPTGLIIDNSSPAVRKAYMEKFYPNIKPDTKITIYRGVQEGEVPGVSLGTTGPAAGRVEPGGGAWWTTNPYVAQRLAETQGRKIATLTVSWDELQKIDPTFVPGPRSGGFGLDDEVIVDYTSDAFKSVQGRVSMSERIEGIPGGSAVQENALSGLQRIVFGEAEDSLNVDDLVTVRPSSVNGTEHALHLWQTADGVAIPHMKDIEDLKTYRNLGPEWLQTYGVNLPQNITDLWSLGTLYGFRFSQRSAIEDYWAYVVTSGRLDYLYKGRKAAMAFREARPNIRIVARDGKNKVVVDSRLGMFAKRFRKVGDKIKSKTDYGSPSLTSQILSVAFLENLDEAEVLAANIAFKNKDAEALKALHMKALGRYRLSGLSQQNMDDLVDLVDTSFGLKQLDEVAEQGAMINSGALPNPNLMVPGSDVPGVKTFSIPDDAKTVLGAFVDVPKGAKNYNLFWFNALHGIAELDGPIGKIAISDILDKDRAVARIADTIRKDTKFGYKDRLSMIYTGDVSIDEFARRYYEDVRNMLSNKDGKLNMKLIDTLAPVGDDGVRVVDIYDIGENGEKILKISPAAMRQYGDDAPEFVLGRNEIPMPQSEATLIDRGWNVLGEQYNRISKEPIALANYMEQRDILRPYQSQLAAEVGDEAARKITARMAMDRAVGFTLSYSDNPANRSQLAWKVRNFSRYYRATEDFYRRAFRLAKNYPVAFWKTALTYQVLEDTGMIFEDDNGNKYFAYPGTDILNSAMRGGFSWLFGDNIHLDLKPSFFGAQVNMLAPSSDINQLLPTPTGPIGVVPVKTLFGMFPEMQRFERYILGEYAAQGSWYDSLIPGQAARVLRAMSTDERYSMYGSAIMDAVAIAVAEDLLPGDFQNIDQIDKSDEIQGIRNIAMGTVITKLLLGFTVPASPQVYSETATDYARQNGIESMRSAFLELVRAYDGDIQKAYRQWWRLNKDGDLMPFTVSRTEVSRDTVASFADVQPVFGLEDWYNDNKELYKKYPNASLLLAPKTGDFSFDSWNVLTRTLGIRVPKDVNTFMLDALSAKTQFQYMATLADYRKDIDALDPRIEDDRKRISQLESDRSDDINWLERQDPYWAQNRAENSNRAQAENYAMTMYAEAKIMVNELKENGQATDVSSSIRSAIYTYEDYMTDIKMITGNTEAERDQKRQLRYEMERDLRGIAGRNENVKSFIENVLYWEPEFGEQ